MGSALDSNFPRYGLRPAPAIQEITRGAAPRCRVDPLETPFLDLSRKVNCCASGQGLLDLVFHPDFPDQNVFFVSYNDRPRGDSVVSRFSVSRDPDRAIPDSEVELLRQPKPEPVHNVGNLEFGRDGYLYIGAGDGGGRANGQDLQTFLGKILRIDVDRGRTYRVPPDNPFVDDPDALAVVHGRTLLPRKRSVRILLDRLRASDPGRADGQVLVLKNGKVRIEALGLDNPGVAVNEVRLGLVNGSIGVRSGSLLIDKYTSSP